METSADFIEVFQGDGASLGDNDKFYWRAVANNGRIVAVGGEPFTSYDHAETAATVAFPAVTDVRHVNFTTDRGRDIPSEREDS